MKIESIVENFDIVAATVLTGKAAFQAAVFAASVTAVASQEWTVWPCYGGGYVQNVVIAPSNPRVWYAYVDVGGPYRSDDAGRRWDVLPGSERVPSGCSSKVLVDRKRLFYLTTGSGVIMRKLP